MKPKIISKKITYKGTWAEFEEAIIELPGGKIVKWESLISEDGVAIVALDKKNNIYLCKEWRIPWEKNIVQLPGGLCFGKTEKQILQQARNELKEEVGFGAKKWKKLVTFLLGVRQKCKIHVFLAQDLYESKKEPDDGEIIKIVKMPFKKACSIFLQGKIETTSYTVIGIVLAKNELKL